MSNMTTARVSVVGTRPLFWHKFGPDAISLEKQERTGVAGNDPETWRKTTLVTKDGQLFLEPMNVSASIRDGAKYTKRGRGSIQPKVIATLQVVDDRILFDRWMPTFPNGHECDLKTLEVPPTDSELPVYLDIRKVINPNTKSANICYRIVAASGWKCSFTILFDKTVVSRNEMEAVLNDAGKLVGIGNARKIGMGRFNVTEFEVQD